MVDCKKRYPRIFRRRKQFSSVNWNISMRCTLICFFFQHPLGRCQKCICNNNIDPTAPNNCNTTTGECLRCLYNTVGFSCEFCRPGFFGNALTRSCQGSPLNEIRKFQVLTWSIWGKVFKNGPSKICGRQPLKKFEVIWSAMFCPISEQNIGCCFLLISSSRLHK